VHGQRQALVAPTAGSVTIRQQDSFFNLHRMETLMNTLDVHLTLRNLHWFDEPDSAGSAEPCLWTVFFKIDWDTTVVNPSFALLGTATVVSTPGNQGDLPNHDVDAGEDVPNPAVLGEFATKLKPIPLQQPVGDMKEVGGVMGAITALMERDSTPGSAIAKGHAALNKAVQDSLNAVIPTLSAGAPGAPRRGNRGDE
jgi:hypothetical protein